MNKREYIQANKDWLEAKSKEDGVKALPKGKSTEKKAFRQEHSR